MKRILSLLLLLVIAGIFRSTAQIASFSFAGPSTVSGWTNVPGDPALGVQTATAGGVTLSSVAQANWSPNGNGNCAYNYGGAPGASYFPTAVMGNSWIQYNGSSYNLALYSAGTPQIELTGLNPDSTYILRMSGSEKYFTNDGMTQYTVSGLTVYGSQQLNTFSNTTQGVTFQNVKPDASGMIRVYVNASSTSYFAWISGLQIFAGSANVGTPVVAMTAPANGTVQSEGGNFILTATATETGSTIAKVEFYADTTKIGEADAAPYTMTWVDPDPGSYQLTAKATDAVGTISTASVNVGVQSLNYFWSTTGNIATGGDTSFVGTVDSNRLAFRTKNIERMSILPTGNIGIGTTTPTAQLHTTGSVRLAGVTSDSTKTRVLVSDTSGNLYYRNASSLTGHWQYANGTVYDSVDNIAIGTSNPYNYKLAVNGTAIFTKAKVKTAGTWPDYVFEQGYRLPDLKDLEVYLQTHHHLPDIPSQAQVQQDGIDLSEHAAALLKKVEELTLYTIRQDKQLAEQNARLEAQQKEIDELKALIKDKKN